MNCNFSPFPVQTTERLILRQATLADDNEIFFERSDALMNKYVDPGPGVSNFVASPGGFDVFILKLSSNGDYAGATSIGSTYNDLANGIVLGPSGDIIITGYFNNTVDFDPGGGVMDLVAAGQDGFIARFNNITGLQEVAGQKAFSFYPNPASNIIILRSAANMSGNYWSIADQTGRVVLTGTLSGSQTSVDITSLSSGCYIVEMGNLHRQKLLVLKE